jgi:hypothetical protein
MSSENSVESPFARPPDDSEPFSTYSRSLLGAMSYADIEAVEAEWLWDGRIPLGEVTVLAAMGGTGKTFAMCDLAARVTRGDTLPGGTPPGPPGTVFIVNAEDDASTVLVHRLAAGPRRSVAGDRLQRAGRWRVRPRRQGGLCADAARGHHRSW